jgi:DNA-binding beta-propeller fold protein YncE
VWVDRAKDEIYVADTLNDLIAVYDAKGLPLFAFGYNQELKEPIKAVSDPKGRIFVLNGIPRAVKVFNYRGDYLNDFTLSPTSPKSYPNAVALDRNGNVYVALAGELGGQIQIYDPTFQLVRKFGEKPDGSSYFKSVQAIAIDSDGMMYISDANATPSIQVFSPDGRFVRGWGAHDAGPHNFSLPAGLAIDGGGRIIVVDSLRHAITVFTKDGTFLGRHGGMGSQPGAVGSPTDIATNGKERIYVVERLGSRLQVLEERLVTTRASSGAASAANVLREQMRRQFNDFTKGMK